MLSTDEGSEKESQKVGIDMEDELEEDDDGSLSKIPVAPRGLGPCLSHRVVPVLAILTTVLCQH